MKKYLQKLGQVTVACLISMCVYILTYWITSTLLNEASKSLYLIVLVIYSLVFMSVFTFILIRRTYIKNSVGEKIALQDFQNGYSGFGRELILVFKRELSTLIVFAFINAASWIMISIDKLIFSKRTVTAILLVFAPLNIIGVTLPTWANSLLAYLVGTILCFAIYILELAIFRRKWYLHWNKKKDE